MKRLGIVLACLATLWSAQPARSQEAHPIQLALWAPVQIVPENEAVRGFRLSLLYGVNTAMSGLDVGLVTRTTGEFRGVQFGAVGMVDGDFTGWQDNWVNVVHGAFEGLQSGLVSTVEMGRGVQASGVNTATLTASVMSRLSLGAIST